VAILIHRCKCGHPDIYHGGTRDRACEMACGCQRADLAPEPELLPTWDGRGKPVTTITEPGTRWCHGLTLCQCPLCEAEHSQLDGAVA
jgi:hypothetical protein